MKCLFHDLIAGRNIVHLNGKLFFLAAVRLFAVSAQGIHGDGYLRGDEHICCSFQQLIFFLIIEIIPHIGFLIAAGRSALCDVIALGNFACMIQVFTEGELGEAFIVRTIRCHQITSVSIVDRNICPCKFFAGFFLVHVFGDVYCVSGIRTEKAA